MARENGIAKAVDRPIDRLGVVRMTEQTVGIDRSIEMGVALAISWRQVKRLSGRIPADGRLEQVTVVSEQVRVAAPPEPIDVADLGRPLSIGVPSGRLAVVRWTGAAAAFPRLIVKVLSFERSDPVMSHRQRRERTPHRMLVVAVVDLAVASRACGIADVANIGADVEERRLECQAWVIRPSSGPSAAGGGSGGGTDRCVTTARTIAPNTRSPVRMKGIPSPIRPKRGCRCRETIMRS